MINSPVVILYDSNGTPVAVLDNTNITANQPGIIVLGSDGTKSHYIKVLSDGTVSVTVGNFPTIQTINGSITGSVIVNGSVTVGNFPTSVTVNNFPTLQAVTPGGASTSTITSVTSSASNITLLAANPNRKAALFFNDSTQILYLKLGTNASITSYTVKLLAGGYCQTEIPVFTGEVDGVWSSANGNCLVTELLT